MQQVYLLLLVKCPDLKPETDVTWNSFSAFFFKRLSIILILDTKLDGKLGLFATIGYGWRGMEIILTDWLHAKNLPKWTWEITRGIFKKYLTSMIKASNEEPSNEANIITPASDRILSNLSDEKRTCMLHYLLSYRKRHQFDKLEQYQIQWIIGVWAIQIVTNLDRGECFNTAPTYTTYTYIIARGESFYVMDWEIEVTGVVLDWMRVFPIYHFNRGLFDPIVLYLVFNIFVESYYTAFRRVECLIQLMSGKQHIYTTRITHRFEYGPDDLRNISLPSLRNRLNPHNLIVRFLSGLLFMLLEHVRVTYIFAKRLNMHHVVSCN